MGHARQKMELDLNIRLGYPVRELGTLVPQKIQPTHIDIRRPADP